MKNLIPIILFIGLFILATQQLVNALNLPEVYFSNYTNQCAAVIEHGKQSMNYHCQKLPVKYTKVWIK